MAIKMMQGNEAIAWGAITAGCRFFAGYPITPSTEIAEILSRELPKIGGKFIQMEDEIASLAACIGASVGGLKSMTATSGPGFSLMQENIGYAVMTEVPCVIVNVQRLGPSTGQPTSPSQGDVMQARWGTHGDHPIIVLCPTSIPQAYQQTIYAFNFSEAYRTPVILLLDEVVGHMREKFELPEEFDPGSPDRPTIPEPPEWYRPYGDTPSDVPPMANFGEGYRYHITGLFHDQMGYPTQRRDEIDPWIARVNRKIERNLYNILLYESDIPDQVDTLIIAYGVTARSASHAVKLARLQDLHVGLLTLYTLWPFPEDLVERLAATASRVIVPELNQGQLALEVERVVGRDKVTRINLANGKLIPPPMILNVIADHKP